jgi:hypothetical protein
MSLGWLHISLRGRLSPKIPRRRTVAPSIHPRCDQLILAGPSNGIRHHWSRLAYELAPAWPLFALSAKRLHDSGRSPALAMLAAVALPFADAASLAFNYGALDIVPAAITSLPGILISCTWTGLMWYIYRL